MLESTAMSDQSPFLEHNGKKYARVTAVIRKPGAFSHIDPATLARKAQVGTNVHAAISAYIHNECFPLTGEEMEYFRSFIGWTKAINPTFSCPDTRLYCDKLRITGAIDTLIAFEGDGTYTLVDFKTSAAEDKVHWPLQGHLYYHLLRGASYGMHPRFLFVKLDKEGDLPKVCEYRYDPYIHDTAIRMIHDFWHEHESLVD